MSKLSLYIQEKGKEKQYAFGPPVVATMMWVDDYGFPTEDEAVLDWYHNVWKKGQKNGNRKTENG